MVDRALSLELCLASALLLGLACAPPQALPTAPEAVQSEEFLRDMALPKEKLFPKIVPVLMDLGYQVRVANAELGHVSFSRTWIQKWGLGNLAPLSMEATLYFQPMGPSMTKARVLIHIQASGLEYQKVDPKLGKALLESIENGLVKGL